jgi:Rrf2 family iron-sulfur cluster assembly transcriptional regulator
MNITSKSRYALKIMMDLAESSADRVQRHDIAGRQGIPPDYMDHILSRLRDAGLILSIRGRGGGYRLAKPADEISMLEIFVAVEDAFEPVQCLEGGVGCMVSHICSSKDVWTEISNAIRQSLSGIILSDVVAKKLPGTPAFPLDALSEGLNAAGARPPVVRLQECRAPKKRAGGSH